MTEMRESRDVADAVFEALRATARRGGAARRAAFDSERINRGMMATMPLVLAGAMTVSLNITAPIDAAHAAEKRPSKAKSALGEISLADAGAPVAESPAAAVDTASLPSRHTVVAGDTVASIAGHYGLSTASLLAINGLGWKSLIFPGQTLKLSTAKATPATSGASASASRYTIKAGDTVSAVASRHGVSTKAILTANGLSATSIIYPGQTLAIPSGATMSLASSVTRSPAPSRGAARSYTIVSGDTIGSIAAKHGLAIADLLAANGLSSSSVIFAGRTLTIPAAPVIIQDGTTVTPLTAEMKGNARTIIRVGRELGVSDRGIVIALAAAMQESSLRNIDYGDRDSVGLFQQRPSQKWGPASTLLDPAHAARLFYGGPSNPNLGVTRGLLEIPGWRDMTVTQAAQAVQISAFPDAYARWEKSARAWLEQLG